MIRDGNYTNFNDLINKIDNYLVNTRTEAEMKAAILRRLEYSAMNIGKGIVDIDSLVEGDAVIDLSDLTIIEEKRLVSSLILAALYMHYMRRGGLIERGVRHVLIIEEAQNLLDIGGSSYSIIDHIIMELAKYGLRVVLVSNAVPKSSILKHCNIVLFKINPELLDGEVMFSRNLINKLNEISTEEAIVISSKGITRVRPLRATIEPTHVVIRRLGELGNGSFQDINTNMVNSNLLLNNKPMAETDNRVSTNNEIVNRVDEAPGHDKRAMVRQVSPDNGGSTLPNSAVINNGDSLFRKQIMELEKEVVNLRDKVNEIERILDADEKLIEKILELDGKLKNDI